MQTVAAVTMVRDDAFFLRAWLRHYGAMFGRENCYVINHGGLRRYYRHVIVGDVDELVVVDPDAGMNLREWLEQAPENRIYTPVGLEVIHRIDREDQPADDQILGPRRHVRLAPHYSKPCITSTPAKLSRGGHFAQYGKLHTPDALYLMHLKFCDFSAYAEAMDRRNAVTADVGGSVKDAAIGRHWWVRRKMQRSFAPRGDTGYYEFKRPEFPTQYKLPDRFNGLF